MENQERKLQLFFCFLVFQLGTWIIIWIELIWLIHKSIDPFLERPVSFKLPVMEGQSNLTALDLQIKKLRDASVASIRQMAQHMREEATDVKATVSEFEDWLERLKQLAEEVRDQNNQENLDQLKSITIRPTTSEQHIFSSHTVTILESN